MHLTDGALWRVVGVDAHEDGAVFQCRDLVIDVLANQHPLGGFEFTIRQKLFTVPTDLVVADAFTRGALLVLVHPRLPHSLALSALECAIDIPIFYPHPATDTEGRVIEVVLMPIDYVALVQVVRADEDI